MGINEKLWSFPMKLKSYPYFGWYRSESFSWVIPLLSNGWRNTSRKSRMVSYNPTMSTCYGAPLWNLNLRLAIDVCQLWCITWSRGNVLASRSKVHGFKPDWCRWLFQDVIILSTSPSGVTFSWGFRVWDFRLVKEPQAWKKGLCAKFNDIFTS